MIFEVRGKTREVLIKSLSDVPFIDAFARLGVGVSEGKTVLSLLVKEKYRLCPPRKTVIGALIPTQIMHRLPMIQEILYNVSGIENVSNMIYVGFFPDISNMKVIRRGGFIGRDVIKSFRIPRVPEEAICKRDIQMGDVLELLVAELKKDWNLTTTVNSNVQILVLTEKEQVIVDFEKVLEWLKTERELERYGITIQITFIGINSSGLEVSPRRSTKPLWFDFDRYTIEEGRGLSLAEKIFTHKIWEEIPSRIKGLKISYPPDPNAIHTVPMPMSVVCKIDLPIQATYVNLSYLLPGHRRYIDDSISLPR